jgi:hypothetical protein
MRLQPQEIASRTTLLSLSLINGVPVTGLAAGNFEIEALIVGPGGALVTIAGVSPGRLAGFY